MQKKGLLVQLPNLDLILTKTRPGQVSLDKTYTPERSCNLYNSVMCLSNRQQVTLTITRAHVFPPARGKRKILFDDLNRQPCPAEGDRSVGGDRRHPRRQINCPRKPDCDPLPVADLGSLCFFRCLGHLLGHRNEQKAEETCLPHRCSLQRHGHREGRQNALGYTVRMTLRVTMSH